MTAKFYQKKSVQLMRPYVPGEDLIGVSVAPGDTPKQGGMIAMSVKPGDTDQWYVSPEFFEKNYREVLPSELGEALERDLHDWKTAQGLAHEILKKDS